VSGAAGGPHPEQWRIGVLGAGRVGQALALGLTRAGHRATGVWSRDPARAERTAALAHAPVRSPQGVADDADLVLITVSDDAIADVCGLVRWRPGVWAAHVSGARDLDVLGHARAAGAGVGSLHPMMAFGDAETSLAALRGATFTVEAEGEALGAVLAGLADDLGGVPLRLPPGGRALYHASGQYAAAFVVALLSEAAELWTRLGFSRDDALRTLLPLARGTLDGVERAGLAGGLVGPVARGDVGTVERHLKALSAGGPETSALYTQLTSRLVPLAREAGLGADAAARLVALLPARAAEDAQ
jgi:predicted short-subunit dehydrogenase-like oxidoreductase (DUF2520 family)